MNLSLPSDLKELIEEQIKSGQYVSAEELVCDALHNKFANAIQFETLSNRKTDPQPELVFSKIHESIYSESLKPGEYLGTENDIAQMMQVERLSAEKAMKALWEAGCVEKDENETYFVTFSKPHISVNPFSTVTTCNDESIYDLLEVRAGLESYGVVLAVERATDQDIQFMEEALSKDRANTQDKNSARDADIAFHLGIAYATHNIIYIDLIKRLYEQMFSSINELHSLLYETPKNLEIIEQHHFKILSAISGRDKDGAKRHMLQHIMFLKSFLSTHARTGAL